MNKFIFLISSVELHDRILEVIGVDLLITLTADEANANNVTIAFTMGTKALTKGHAVEVLLLSDRVRLASNGYAEIIDADYVVDAIMAAKKTLQLN